MVKQLVVCGWGSEKSICNRITQWVLFYFVSKMPLLFASRPKPIVTPFCLRQGFHKRRIEGTT